jgi:hypothetical protein
MIWPGLLIKKFMKEPVTLEFVGGSRKVIENTYSMYNIINISQLYQVVLVPS